MIQYKFIEAVKKLKKEYSIEFIVELPAHELRDVNRRWKAIHKAWLDEIQMDPYCQMIREKHKLKALKNRKRKKEA